MPGRLADRWLAGRVLAPERPKFKGLAHGGSVFRRSAARGLVHWCLALGKLVVEILMIRKPDLACSAPIDKSGYIP